MKQKESSLAIGKNVGRNSKIELLRIIAMVIIFIGHWLGQSGVQFQGSNRILVYFLGSGGRISAGLFLLISAYFLCDLSFKTKRAINIWLQMFFYNFVIGGICFLFVRHGAFSFIKGFCPIFGGHCWFGMAYIIWLLFMPVMQTICKKLPDKLMLYFVIIQVLFFSIEPTVHSLQDSKIAVITWFCFVYYLMYFLKHNTYSPINSKLYKKTPSYIFILAGLLIYILLVSIKLNISNELILKAINEFLADYKSVPSFMIGMLLLIGTIKSKPVQCNVINFISKKTFAVYLIHQNGLLIPYLWKDIFKANLVVNYSTGKLLIYILIIITITFSSAILLEFIRELVHKLISRWKIYINLCLKLDAYIMKINE